jgi:hypothetical protein
MFSTTIHHDARPFALLTALLVCACSKAEHRPHPELPGPGMEADAGAASRPDVPPVRRSPSEAPSTAAVDPADAGAPGEAAADAGEDPDGADSGVLAGSTFGDCDITAPTRCSDPPLRYADVEPIFMQRCTSCHGGMDGRWPLTTYQHVADWYAEIRGQMLSCSMPPSSSGLSMPRAERERILLWIRCGFPR